MNTNEHMPLDENLWRRELNSKEIQDLKRLSSQSNREADDFLMDIQLGELIRSLPNAPVSSNFTSRVLQQIEQEESRAAAPRQPILSRLSSLWLRWMPRAALACLCFGVIVVSWRFQENRSRQLMANSIRDMASIAVTPSLNGKPSIEVWQDFEVIQKLGAVAADDELIQVVNQIQ